MKKIIIMLFCFALIFSLCACKNDNKKSTDSDKISTSSSEEKKNKESQKEEKYVDEPMDEDMIDRYSGYKNDDDGSNEQPAENQIVPASEDKNQTPESETSDEKEDENTTSSEKTENWTKDY